MALLLTVGATWTQAGQRAPEPFSPRGPDAATRFGEREAIRDDARTLIVTVGK